MANWFSRSKPVKRRPPWLLVVVLLIVVIVGSKYWPVVDSSSPSTDIDNAPSERFGEGVYEVVRVVDGDTLVLERTVERREGDRTVNERQHIPKLRLIGVNTPETVKDDHPVERWGPEATEFTRRFLAGGKARLQLDKERFDQYNRVLGYIWVGDRMLNEELIRAGLGHAALQYRYAESMKRRFRRAQQDAQDDRVGIWSGKALSR